MEEQSFKENHEDLMDKIQEINRKLKLDSKERKKSFPRKKVPFKEQLINAKPDLLKIKYVFYFIGVGLGAMLIGGLIRGENEFSLFEELKKPEDLLNSILCVILYLNLLVWLFVFSYYLLYSIYYFRLEGMENTELWNKVKEGKKTKSIFFSIWFVLFFFLFHKSIFLFINNMPDDIWNGWPLIVFLIFSALIGYFILKKDD